MAKRISIDIDKLKDIHETIGLLLRGGTEASVDIEPLGPVDESDLTKREKAVLNYIKRNPGKTKQQVVDHFVEIVKKYSRGPILDSIKILAELEMIVVKKEHRQKHSLYINDKSLLISEFRNLEEFRDSFLNLLREAKRKFDKLYKKEQKRKSDGDSNLSREIESFKTDMIILIHDMFQYMVDTYGLVALFRWPAMTSDNEILRRLYAGVFAKLREILLSSFEFIPSINEPKLILEEIMTERYDDLLRFKPLIENSYKRGLEKEFDPVMQCIWNIRSDISTSLPTPRGHSMPIIKDYKEALATLEKNFKEAEAELE
jgi:hypothetical protein